MNPRKWATYPPGFMETLKRQISPELLDRIYKHQLDSQLEKIMEMLVSRSRSECLWQDKAELPQ